VKRRVASFAGDGTLAQEWGITLNFIKRVKFVEEIGNHGDQSQAPLVYGTTDCQICSWWYIGLVLDSGRTGMGNHTQFHQLE